jgi:flagellar hook-basal body complex protein FliE
MSINKLEGLSAYARAAGRPLSSSPIGSEENGGNIAAAGVSGGGNFASLIGNMFTDAAKATRTSEAVSRQSVTGKADLVDVVQAINNAEVALESVVAVRDRVVGAYQEIMRMQI